MWDVTSNFPVNEANGHPSSIDQFENGRPSSLVTLVRSMNEHGQATGADDLLFALMVTGEIDPVLVRGAANETFDLHLTLRSVDFVDDLVRVEVMHHGPEGY
jgi:hypothetical protein